jgi:tetratricopeptide (TPR) repeat protein
VPISRNRRKGGKKAAKANSPKVQPKPHNPWAEAMSDPALARDASIVGRTAMEAMMAQLQRGLSAPGHGDPFDDTSLEPLDQAQELMYDAWEARTKRERIALAKRALDVSDLCADAWGLLAEEAAKTVVEARGYLEKAVAAGEAAVRQELGPDAFEEEEGQFWGILKTRPYMRARAALAECLWGMGERDAAVAHWRDMLRLCPGDNLGIRHILGPKLLGLNQLDTVRALLEEYKEPDFAEWGYSYALLQFKQGGATSGAAQALKAAIKHNPHVPDYLLGAKRLPKSMPPHYGLGSKDEAVLYVVNAVETWTSTKGSLIWLDDIAKNTL